MNHALKRKHAIADAQDYASVVQRDMERVLAILKDGKTPPSAMIPRQRFLDMLEAIATARALEE